MTIDQRLAILDARLARVAREYDAIMEGAELLADEIAALEWAEDQREKEY